MPSPTEIVFLINMIFKYLTEKIPIFSVFFFLRIKYYDNFLTDRDFDCLKVIEVITNQKTNQKTNHEKIEKFNWSGSFRC